MSHYSIKSTSSGDGMARLRKMFPDGIANELNFVLFSTSGVHGTYSTIEDEQNPEAETLADLEIDRADYEPCITFLIVHPRWVCLEYGNCEPECAADFEFLKRLRRSSHAVVSRIGGGSE